MEGGVAGDSLATSIGCTEADTGLGLTVARGSRFGFGLPGAGGGAVVQPTKATALATSTHLNNCNVSRLAIAPASLKRLQPLHHLKRGCALVHTVEVQTGHAAVAQLVAQISGHV